MKPNQGGQHQLFDADELDPIVHSKCHEQETPILELPAEITRLILIKLPVKTLSILKCVNTYFSRFISSQEFIRDHLRFSTEDASMSSYTLLLRNNIHAVFKQTSLQSFCNKSPVHLVTLDYPIKELAAKRVRLVGSCNGLVLIIVNGKHMYVWNPTIRKHKKLPSIVGHEYLEATDPRFFCGFGFDASGDDYKVVAMFSYVRRPHYQSTRDYLVSVYSIKRNSWIRIPDFAAEEFVEFSGTFISGKLHWCTGNRDIVYVDVEREVFGTLDLPEGLSSGYCLLRILGGSITVCCYHADHVDVWVMKEYGMVVSWTKTLNYDREYLHPQPSYILPNGEVLNCDGVIDIYNPKDQSRHSTKILCNESVVYVESLVSPCCN